MQLPIIANGRASFVEVESDNSANILFRKYCGSNSTIQPESMKFMLKDIYSFSHSHYEELNKDRAAEQLYRLMDMDRDQKLSLRDVETCVESALRDQNSNHIASKAHSIRQENHQAQLASMKRAFDGFSAGNTQIAKDVFRAYDIEQIGYVDIQDLPLILEDVCAYLGTPTVVDRDLLMARVQGFNFRTKGKVSTKEFEFLYTQRFDI